LVNQALQFIIIFAFYTNNRSLWSFSKAKKVLAINGDYSSLQRILKEVFEIDGEIIIQKYEADWEDFVDLVDFADVQDRAKLKVLKKLFFLLSAEKSFVF